MDGWVCGQGIFTYNPDISVLDDGWMHDWMMHGWMDDWMMVGWMVGCMIG